MLLGNSPTGYGGLPQAYIGITRNISACQFLLVEKFSPTQFQVQIAYELPQTAPFRPLERRLTDRRISDQIAPTAFLAAMHIEPPGFLRTSPRFAWLVLVLILLPTAWVPMSRAEKILLVPKWTRFEQTFKSATDYPNPLQQVEMRVVFTSPTGASTLVDAFWDGGNVWRVRFAPNQLGRWVFSTICSDPSNSGLENQSGSFVCTAPRQSTLFEQHGPIRLSFNRRYLVHDDTTPFFWLADTAWNGALLSTTDEWNSYIAERKRQKFTAVQFVVTQFRACPEGNRDHQLAFTGPTNSIAINPRFFQALDQKLDALDHAGLLSAPVLLWAVAAGSNPRINPGFALAEDQAILLARYMVARWGANNVVWILGGDGDYRGPNAPRWQRIGRQVFSEPNHALVTLHPGGQQWIATDFLNEEWLDILGYQSGHGDDEAAWQWIFQGPPATEWTQKPFRPLINLEPCYENHLGYQSRLPHSPANVRRAIYWSLLSTPTAGVTYGGHGVWGWDDGKHTPTDHPSTGVPLPWQQALHMPAASQMTVLANLFTSIEFWRLRPAPELLAIQPGTASPIRHIAAARADRGDLAVVYTPQDPISIRADFLPRGFQATWFDPRSGQTTSANAVQDRSVLQFTTPGEGDWVLLIQAHRSS